LGLFRREKKTLKWISILIITFLIFPEQHPSSPSTSTSVTFPEQHPPLLELLLLLLLLPPLLLPVKFVPESGPHNTLTGQLVGDFESLSWWINPSSSSPLRLVFKGSTECFTSVGDDGAWPSSSKPSLNPLLFPAPETHRHESENGTESANEWINENNSGREGFRMYSTTHALFD